MIDSPDEPDRFDLLHSDLIDVLVLPQFIDHDIIQFIVGCLEPPDISHIADCQVYLLFFCEIDIL